MFRSLLISIFCILLGNNTHASEDYILIENFKKVSHNKIIFMRHALAPGNGDPSNFKIDDCSTQRNLDVNGIYQSEMIGEIFKKFQITFTKIFSSFWCRCKDTASFLKIGKFVTHKGLNSFYQGHVNKDKTIAELNKLINKLRIW